MPRCAWWWWWSPPLPLFARTQLWAMCGACIVGVSGTLAAGCMAYVYLTVPYDDDVLLASLVPVHRRHLHVHIAHHIHPVCHTRSTPYSRGSGGTAGVVVGPTTSRLLLLPVAVPITGSGGGGGMGAVQPCPGELALDLAHLMDAQTQARAHVSEPLFSRGPWVE